MKTTAVGMREAETRSVKALHGLSRSLVYNMVQGVSQGFTKQLEIEGVGFKAAVQGPTLNLSLGFSHPVHFQIPKDIKITVTDATKINIEGVDKKLVGQVAADIRGFYPPEPYKERGALSRRADSAQGGIQSKIGDDRKRRGARQRIGKKDRPPNGRGWHPFFRNTFTRTLSPMEPDDAGRRITLRVLAGKNKDDAIAQRPRWQNDRGTYVAKKLDRVFLIAG